MPQTSHQPSDRAAKDANRLSNSRVSDGGKMATSYGFQQVKDGEKQPLVNDVFHKVASHYDTMNDLMSGGMHRLWKRAMVDALGVPRSPNLNWQCIDVAGGTGDIAMRIVDASNMHAKVDVLDINSSMLQVGEARADKRAMRDQINFVNGNAESLPFEANLFDAYTIAFGIRNIPDINAALAQAFRVLKPGGRFLCLEFSDVEMPILDKIYDQWSMHAIPKIGKLVMGDEGPYQYLVESIRKFPNQQSFATMISDAGFEKVTFQNYTGGIAALHSGWKI